MLFSKSVAILQSEWNSVAILQSKWSNQFNRNLHSTWVSLYIGMLRNSLLSNLAQIHDCFRACTWIATDLHARSKILDKLKKSWDAIFIYLSYGPPRQGPLAFWLRRIPIWAHPKASHSSLWIGRKVCLSYDTSCPPWEPERCCRLQPLASAKAFSNFWWPELTYTREDTAKHGTWKLPSSVFP